MNQKKRPMEFSKKIFVGISLMVVVTMIFSFAAMWYTRDLSALPYMITAVFAELAVGTGFYFNKAQKENVIKLEHFAEEGMLGDSPVVGKKYREFLGMYEEYKRDS